MTERQRKFREQYIAQISPWYHGLVHIGVMYAAGIGGVWWCLSRIQDARWEWLVAIPVALAGNFIEWGMHKYVMHRLRDVFAVRSIYDRHTRQHHQYFTDLDPTISTIKEFRIVFFPWRVLTVLAVAGGLISLAVATLVNANAGYITFVTMIGHYMVYETFHFCCHVQENWFVRNAPFINTIRRHHAAHHNMGIMMHLNMNLTFPVADWVMGTSDLDRGLLGHLFNGYDQKYVKEELKPVIARFRTSETQDARCTLDGPALTDDEVRSLSNAASHA